MKKIYLGDSVYAEWLFVETLTSRCMPVLVITTNNGYPDDPRNKIWMEPEVLDALNQFIAKGPPSP